MKQNKITELLPPGLSFREERNFFLVSWGAACAFTAIFWIRYFNALNDLYVYRLGSSERVLLEGAQMKPFSELYDGVSAVWLLVCMASLFLVLRHYIYHYQGAKSVYLMRRLPHPLEWHVRCCAVPMLLALVALISAVAFCAIDYGLYLLLTPDACHGAPSTAEFWRALI